MTGLRLVSWQVRGCGLRLPRIGFHRLAAVLVPLARVGAGSALLLGCLAFFVSRSASVASSSASLNRVERMNTETPATQQPGTAERATGNAAQERLVWADEFNGQSPTARTAPTAPDPARWTYDTGHAPNHELEIYCAYGSNAAPCQASAPNAYVAGGDLHLVARRNAQGGYTSARLKTEGLAGFQYGRFEANIRIPAGGGLWPAFWMLGDSIQSVGWPACGEFDIMENIGREPSTIHGSIHGPGFIGDKIGLPYSLPRGARFSSGFHRFGMIWSPRRVQYYVDDPQNIYATFTPASLPPGAIWPFDKGRFFLILNLAVGGDWPGPPGHATAFPAEMLVDYVRVWQRTP